ncbi:MAG TPA: DUF4169 family protein [Caulobacteraceae bacterium]
MAELVNLNRARKAKARTGAEAKAAENRVKFGRAKADRRQGQALADKAARDLDAKKRDR